MATNTGNMGNALGMTALAAVVLLGLIVLSAVVLYAPGSSSAHTITVSASGSASEVATQAQFSVAANGTGSTAALALANLSATMSKVNQTILPYVGGNYSKLSTTYFSVQKVTCPTYYYTLPANYSYPVCTSTGYAATEGVSVTMSNYDNAGTAISALANISNVYIGSVYSQLSTSQVSALRQQAITSAVANATYEAQLAAPAGTYVTIQNITLVQYNSPSPYYALAASNVASQPTLYSGVGTVTVNVGVTFSYK